MTMNPTNIAGPSESQHVLKRKRTQEPQNSDNAVDDILSKPPIVRDERYYMDDEGADCVILASNVLFKIHRFILSRDSSAFGNMFTMPVGRGDDGLVIPREGCSDENPIVLQEDADHFRSLLWALYALPRDLQQHQGPSADLNLLINLATVTHKYHFATTETWSLDAICNVMSKGSAIWKTSPSLAVILGLAMLCEHEPLRELVISTWVSRLLSAELPPIPAILAADKYELPQLLGAAYYAQVLEMDKTNSTFTPPSDDELSRGQLIALLSGHWALVKRWEHLQMRPLTFQRSTGCTMHVHGCVAMWNAQWNKHRRSETLLAYPSADILGRLQCLLALLEADELVSQQLTAGCRASALRELASVIVAQKITLADFFVDRTQPAPGSPSSH